MLKLLNMPLTIVDPLEENDLDDDEEEEDETAKRDEDLSLFNKDRLNLEHLLELVVSTQIASITTCTSELLLEQRRKQSNETPEDSTTAKPATAPPNETTAGGANFESTSLQLVKTSLAILDKFLEKLRDPVHRLHRRASLNKRLYSNVQTRLAYAIYFYLSREMFKLHKQVQSETKENERESETQPGLSVELSLIIARLFKLFKEIFIESNGEKTTKSLAK